MRVGELHDIRRNSGQRKPGRRWASTPYPQPSPGTEVAAGDQAAVIQRLPGSEPQQSWRLGKQKEEIFSLHLPRLLRLSREIFPARNPQGGLRLGKAKGKKKKPLPRELSATTPPAQSYPRSNWAPHLQQIHLAWIAQLLLFNSKDWHHLTDRQTDKGWQRIGKQGCWAFHSCLPPGPMGFSHKWGALA